MLNNIVVAYCHLAIIILYNLSLCSGQGEHNMYIMHMNYVYIPVPGSQLEVALVCAKVTG